MAENDLAKRIDMMREIMDNKSFADMALRPEEEDPKPTRTKSGLPVDETDRDSAKNRDVDQLAHASGDEKCKSFQD